MHPYLQLNYLSSSAGDSFHSVPMLAPQPVFLVADYLPSTSGFLTGLNDVNASHGVFAEVHDFHARDLTINVRMKV
jgi:hypothetical protein